MLFLARDGMRGQLVDIETQTTLRNYAIGEVSRNALVYSPISQAVIAHQARNCALFLSATTQQPLQRSFTPELVTSCAVTRCGTYMVAGTANGTLLLWNLQSGELIKNYKAHLRVVHCVALSPDDSLVATASEDSVCKVWTLATLASLRMREIVPRCVFTGHSLGVTCCTFLQHTSVLVTGSSDRTCRLVDPNTGDQLRTVTVGDAVTALTVGLDDTALVAGTLKGFLFFTQLSHASPRLPLDAEREDGAGGGGGEAILRPPSADGHHSAVVFVRALPSRPAQVLTASEGGAVLWFDMLSGRLVRECVSPQKGRLLSCCVVPRVALQVKGSCAALDKNPIDPSSGHYHVTQHALALRQPSSGGKRSRSGGDAEGNGERGASSDTDAGLLTLQATRAKAEELRGLQTQLRRRLLKLRAARSA